MRAARSVFVRHLGVLLPRDGPVGSGSDRVARDSRQNPTLYIQGEKKKVRPAQDSIL